MSEASGKTPVGIHQRLFPPLFGEEGVSGQAGHQISNESGKRSMPGVLNLRDVNYFIVRSHILEIEVSGMRSCIIAREGRDDVVSFYSISDSYEVK